MSSKRKTVSSASGSSVPSSLAKGDLGKGSNSNPSFAPEAPNYSLEALSRLPEGFQPDDVPSDTLMDLPNPEAFLADANDITVIGQTLDDIKAKVQAKASALADDKTVIGQTLDDIKAKAAQAKAPPLADDKTVIGQTLDEIKAKGGALPPAPPVDSLADDKTVIGQTLDDIKAKGGALPPAPPVDSLADDKTVIGQTLDDIKAKGGALPPAPPVDSLADDKTVIGQTLDDIKAKGAKPPAPPPADANDKTIVATNLEQAKPQGKGNVTSKTSTPQTRKQFAPIVDENKTVMFAGGKSEDEKTSFNDNLQENKTHADVFGKKTSGNGPGGGTQRASQVSAWPVAAADSKSSPSSGTNPSSSGAAGMPEAGMYINQYEIIRKLGEGGMGAVFLARDTRLGRRVAIKFLSSTDPELSKRFVIEARATARVEHENIVSIYEVGEWSQHPFMVLQYLQGNGLDKVIPRGKPMPVPRVIEIMLPVLRALAYAHNEGIVHRDLKPDNIFITDAGVTKVLDFGIAKVIQGDDKTSDGEGRISKEDLASLGADKDMTKHGAVMGTMPYMSPEQWGNGVAIDHTTDIWAVGVMMYTMLSGRHPLYPLSGHELMVTGFLDEPMPSLKEKAPDLPKELIEIVDRCLFKEKARRWPDALSLLHALEPLLKGRADKAKISTEASPYAGLSAFQEDDANRFFGRNREVSAMTQRLRERPLMGVIGPSGIGKSSFLRAGVVPSLKNSGENWEIKVIRPGRDPMVELASLLAKYAAASKGKEKEEKLTSAQLTERLTQEPGYLGTALRRVARRERKNILLFVDQFEELYTLVPDVKTRLAYTSSLAAAADDPASPVRVVVSMRSDFLDRCTEDPNFMNELSQGLFFLTPMTRDGMREALTLPAEMAGYKFEKDSMVNEMLDHLASTSGALPLLQFTADMLWSERDPKRKVLTEQSYKNLGGITGALATHAARVLEQIPEAQRNVVRSIFLRLVTPERTRAIVSMSELKELFGKQAEVERIINQLVEARLLTTSSSGGSAATVEIVHESLIHGWPQLARWLDEGQEDSAFLEQLRNASRQWDAKNRDAGLLWRGEMVEEAKRFVRRFRGNLPEVQQHFLKAVIDQSNRALRFRRSLYVAGAILAMVLLAAAAVALYNINQARKDADRQAERALEQEKVALVAKDEADQQKVAAEAARQRAEKALAEAKAAEAEKEKAREAELKALAEANMSREQLAGALAEARVAERRAIEAAAAATAARATAEIRAREAQEARRDAENAFRLVDVQRKEAQEAKEIAEQKLKALLGSIALDLK